MKACQGNVIRYGDNVDTDVIIPARYLNVFESAELAKHCMEDLDASFVQRVKTGDIMVAGRNFGCGSSREHAPLAIKASGIACVVAESFARIFYRNAINIGLPIMVCKEAMGLKDGDTVAVDFEQGTVTHVQTGTVWQGQPYPPFMRSLMEADGLIPYIANALAKK